LLWFGIGFGIGIGFDFGFGFGFGIGIGFFFFFFDLDLDLGSLEFVLFSVLALIHISSLISAMEYYNQSGLTVHLDFRIKVVSGDLSELNLALSDLEFQRLASEIDVIYHNGCLVNTKLSYSFLRKPNVQSTLGAFVLFELFYLLLLLCFYSFICC
jgi:hypothetical protein